MNQHVPLGSLGSPGLSLPYDLLGSRSRPDLPWPDEPAARPRPAPPRPPAPGARRSGVTRTR